MDPEEEVSRLAREAVVTVEPRGGIQDRRTRGGTPRLLNVMAGRRRRSMGERSATTDDNDYVHSIGRERVENW